ncbi:hypothetical protein [Pseudomonas anguilliseptica]|uniref:hypothetical protein n=1 Tax=Pseudomonas anguilliseptica TaxID=53406 RepID=UPI0022B00FD3|nr:hypothetical protein [Pseudomonas anguilliseptica]MCZ4321460.1 hypothetical protein [Pseudomonas anguilliseptica]
MSARRNPIGFEYEFEFERPSGEIEVCSMCNLVPLPAINHMAASLFGDVAAIGTFHVGIFSANYLPSIGAVAADIPGVIGEFTGYSEATRPVWTRVNSDGLITNGASRAAFTVTQNVRLYGGFLCSASTKGSGDGLLLSIARFPTPRDVEAGTTIRVRGELSLIPTNVA